MLLAVALGATACGNGDAADTDSETIRVMMLPSQAYRLPVVVADQEGMFEERGIELEITEQPANLQGMQGLEATESDIGQVSVTTLVQGWQAGNEGAFFCGGVDFIQTTLMAAVDSDLPSTEEGASWEEVLQSLEGLEIGIQTPVGSGVQLLFAEALAEVGVEDVTYVNLGGGSSAAVAALDNGSVDVAQFSPTGTQFIQDSGSGKPLVYLPDGPSAYKDLYGSGWVAPTEFLEERPEVAGEFCEIMDEALEFIQDSDNKESSTSALVDDTGVSPEVADLVIEQVYGDFSTELDEETLNRTFDTYVDLDIVEAQPEPSYDSLITIPQG